MFLIKLKEAFRFVAPAVFQVYALQRLRGHQGLGVGDLWRGSLHQRCRGQKLLSVSFIYLIYCWNSRKTVFLSSFTVSLFFLREESCGRRFWLCFPITSVSSSLAPQCQMLWSLASGSGKCTTLTSATTLNCGSFFFGIFWTFPSLPPSIFYS